MTASAFQQIPLSELHESKLNLRKHADEGKFLELVGNIKTHGILMPLLVRTNEKGYEIADGHRRFRAAKKAGLEKVPAIIREMDDQAFLECLTISNLQREDIHPMDEARGYQQLLSAKYNVEKIAERVGRSVKYIYDRVKLLSLIDDAQELFLANKITAGHAILLARLKPAEQERAIDEDQGGLWEGEHLPFDESDEASPDPMKTRSVRELGAWIDDHVKFDHKAADPMLFPETVETVRTAIQEVEKVVQITHDHFVQPDAKEGNKERIYGPQSWRRADGRQKSKTCEHSVTGVIVVGAGRGEAFKVCIDKKGCKTHWATEQRDAKQRATDAGKSTAPTAEDHRKEEEKLEAQRQKQQLDERIEQLTMARLIEAIANKAKLPLAGQDLRDLSMILIRAVMCDVEGDYAKLLGFKNEYPDDRDINGVLNGVKPADTIRFLYMATLFSFACSGDDKRVVEAAKRYKIDVKAIEQSVADELKPEKKPKVKKS